MRIKGPEYLTEIAVFVANLLKIENFELDIYQALDLDTQSECIQYEDGSFFIVLEAAISYDALIEHIAHEMVHLRQYHTEQLVVEDDCTFWMGKPHNPTSYMSDEYFLSPWEMEARALEAWIKCRWDERNEL